MAARASDTRRTRVFDVVRRNQWPEPYTGRAPRNAFLERWDGREEDLSAALDTETPAFGAAMREREISTLRWSGQAREVDLISDVAPAAELVRRIGVEAEACQRRGADLLGGDQRTSVT